MGCTAKDGRKRCRCCRMVCPYISVVVGVLLILIAIWSVHLKHRFTPVYTAITCRQEPIELTKFSFLQGLRIDLKSTTTCENPNPYTVTMRSSKDETGQVYIGDEMTPAASLSQIQESTLPAHGSGSIIANIQVEPTGDLITTFIGSLLDMPVYIETRLDLKVDVNFLLGHFTTTKKMSKDCGFNIRPLTSQKGPMACADSFEELKLPPVTGEGLNEPSELTAANMDPEEIEKAKQAKNIGLGLSIGIGFGLGILLLLGGGAVIIDRCCGRRRDARDLSPNHQAVKARAIGREHGNQDEIV